MSDEELASQARKVVRADVATRTFIVFVLAFLVAGTGLLIGLTVENYHRGVENRDTLHALAEQSVLIKSCTTPGEPCFLRAKRQTGRAVSSINRVVILAAACSVNTSPDMSVAQRRIQIQGCVIQQLSKGN